MPIQSLKRLIILSSALALILIFGASIVVAQESTKIAGKITAAFTDRKDVEVGDVIGHVISFSTSEGTNASAGENAFLEGAQVINYSMGDIVKGNGQQRGYIKISKGEDGAIAKWEHNLVTVMSADEQRSTSFEGKFTYTGGTGIYAGIKGGGTFKGQFTSPTEYVVNWLGEYTMGK